MENWQISETDPEELVISSRIRLARNIKNTPFPHKLDLEKSKQIVKNIENAFYTADSLKEDFKTVYLWEKDELKYHEFAEKHIISPALIENEDKAAFIYDNDETVSIMINEEDHIRLQCITGGFDLDECYNMANKYDDLIEETVEYAFDEKIGYITACPTNIGTGLRASAMIHLPALTMNNGMNGILKALTQVGMTIRGLYGEGSKAEGCLYQISNQITMGISELDVIKNLKAIINQIVNQEYQTRDQIYSAYKYELEDKIFRSLGILKNASLMKSGECMNLLSSVRMGVEMGIIKDVDKVKLNKLLIAIQPASLQRELHSNLTEIERDINRARIVKSVLLD